MTTRASSGTRGRRSGARADHLGRDETASELPDLIDLFRALDELSPRQRATVILHEAEGYPLTEVARLIGTSPATARVHLHRGRKRLRELLGSEEVDRT
jgi:RNA polymerase sigma factor (sigma-70 family)